MANVKLLPLAAMEKIIKKAGGPDIRVSDKAKVALKAIIEEKAEDIMEVGIFALHDDASLHDAIKLLDEENIHSIIILSKDNRSLGILTAEAIVNLLAEQVSVESTLDQVDLMPVINIKYDTPISTIMKKMKRTHEYKVVVIDDKGHPAGVLTEMDIIHNYL